MLSARKGSCPTGPPFRMCLRQTLSRPRKNLKSSKSSFRTSTTLVCPSTHVGTTRNTLHILLQSSVSSIRRCHRPSGPKPETQHDRRGRGVPTLTWEEVTIREGKRRCCSCSKKEIMSLRLAEEMIFSLRPRSRANCVGFYTIPYIRAHILGIGLANARKCNFWRQKESYHVLDHFIHDRLWMAVG